MLLYNWKSIFSAAEGDAFEIFLILRMLVHNIFPKNKFDPIYPYHKIRHNFLGQSFMLNADVLIYNAYRHSYRDIGIYASMASYRSYANYLVTKDTTLDLIHLDYDPKEFINDDRLLYVQNERVHFVYEEVPKEKH